MTVNSHHLLQMTHNKCCDILLYCEDNNNAYELASPAADDAHNQCCDILLYCEENRWGSEQNAIIVTKHAYAPS